MDLEEWEDALPFFDDALVVLAETPGGDSPEMVHYTPLPYPACTSALLSLLCNSWPFTFYSIDSLSPLFLLSPFISSLLPSTSPPHCPALSCPILSG